MSLTTTVEISWVAVVVGTIGYQLLGAIWYGPLFGTRWMAAMGYAETDHPDDPGTMGYLLTTVGALVAVLVLAVLVDWTGASTWGDGLVVGLGVGVGFVATTGLQAVPFEDQSWTVYLLNSGYNILALAGVGVLLVVL